MSTFRSAENGSLAIPVLNGSKPEAAISSAAFDSSSFNIIPCAIYIRVSTDEQAKEEHFSLPAQEEYCMGEIRKRHSEGWVHRITISDEGYGGALFERPGLLKLLNMVKAGDIKAVVVYKRDRLFRKMEISSAVQAIFDQYGVRILSHQEGMCDSNPQAVWMGQMIDANSQLERANIRARIVDARRHAAKRGVWQSGTAPFGYHYQKGSKVPPSFNEAEAKVVTYIFEQAAAGTSPCDIAKELRKLKIFGRPRKARVSGQGHASAEIRTQHSTFITSERIREMIGNPFYRGILRVSRTHRDLPRSTRLESEEYEEFRSLHTPIVSDDLWFAANRALSTKHSRRIRQLPTRASGTSMGLLRGLVVCGACDAAMSPGAATRRKQNGDLHRYYRCSLFVKARNECSTRQISADALEAAVIGLMQKFETNPDSFARAGLQNSIRRKETEISRLKDEIAQIGQLIGEQQKSITHFLTFVRTGDAGPMSSDLLSSAGAAKTEIAKLEHERVQLEARLNRLTQRTPPLTELGAAFGLISRSLAVADHKAKSEILQSIVQAIVLTRMGSGLKSEAEARLGKRSFRMVAQIRTNKVMRYGLTDLEALANSCSYADIEVAVTIEIHSNRKRQQVRLLEHAYSVQSASYAPAPLAHPDLDGHDNPIRRAVRWHAMIAGNRMKAYAVASAEKVSPTLVSLHLKLLEKLPQSVIDFLRDGRDSTLKKKISFRELERLAELALPDATAWFHARVAGVPLQDSLPLKS